MAAADEEAHAALRISQTHDVINLLLKLDASELDGELTQLLKLQLNNAFRYFKPGAISWIEPEINAALRLVIWKFSVDALEATVGQQLLNLKYKNESDANVSDSQWMSRRQKIAYAVLGVGGQWLQDRSHDVSRITSRLPFSDQIRHLVRWLESGWKVAALINFLIFLQRGRYQSILERILGIRAVFPQRQAVRQVGFEFMSRELLWHGFAEFLFFIVPLVNFRRLKNMAVRRLFPLTHPSGSSSRTCSDCEECAVCEEWPISPHQIGCRHVFCYYCIQTNFTADPAYSCPKCGQEVVDLQNIQEVKGHIAIPTSEKTIDS